VDKQTLPTHQTLDRLPSLPQVLLKILDAVTNDAADFQHLAGIIRQDSALAARLISVANSSYYRRRHHCDTVDRALMHLGIETVKTLVITAAVKQYFGQFNHQQHQFLRRFWLRSLISANCAQVLASLTSYNSPAEAYLCGLLMDVGQLYLLTNNEASYQNILQKSDNNDQLLLNAEIETLSATHCEASALIVENWQLDNFMADALRYHHQSAAEIQQSHHLVKIINLASELSAQTTPSEQALEKADQLFGFTEELIIELCKRINTDVERIADSMGIQLDNLHKTEADLAAHRQLGEKLSEITQLNALRQNLPATPTVETCQEDFERNLYLSFGIERHIIFFYNESANTLEAKLNHNNSQPDFVIDSRENNCLVNRCFNQQSACSTEHIPAEPLTIIDQQLLGYGRQSHLLCMPFTSNHQKGVLVAGATSTLLQQQRDKKLYWQTLLNALISTFFPASLATNSADESNQTRINEAVHEVSNPLSIINNYLEMLRIKLGNNTDTDNDFTILKEEIDRIGKILLRLKQPDEPLPNEAVDINQTIKDLAHIFNQSMCLTHGINVSLSLDNALKPLQLNKIWLRQILTNLLKNAIEAMPDGGALRITTQSRINVNGKHYFAITIEDNGPGIPNEVMAKLFKPVSTTKGQNHSGLGLSVVKKLTDDMQAQIFCSSDSKGSQFKLLFPVS